MPTVTYDGRSFMLDGRRIWLVSGTVPFPRIPRDQWAARIHQARQAGFNTVETPVFWNRHEPRSGKFDFTGENDLRHFVKLVQAAGMWCILRVGPYVGGGWDAGGIPAWVLENPNVKLRAGNTAFLDACARFTGAVVEQFRDLQVTSAGKGGPVIGVQTEAGWTCGDDAVASHYLSELVRFLRESGVTVPTINNNNLWQGIEGVIDGWSGGDDMLAMMRQLAWARADQPRLVTDLPSGETALLAGEAPAPMEPWRLQRRMAEVLAGGGQFNLSPLCGGVTHGFWGGRLSTGPAAFVSPIFGADAPIGPTGAANESLAMVRRIATFASRFAKTLSGLDPAYQPITFHPGPAPDGGESRGGKKDQQGPAWSGRSVVHCMGQQGAVVFVFADAPGSPPAHLLLPEGLTLGVQLGSQAAAWCLFDTNLTPRAHLDYTNVSALAQIGKVFVCFGPAGGRAVFSINGSVIEVPIATSPTAGPAPVEHEGVHLLALNEEQADRTHLSDDAVYLGVAGLDPAGKPIVHPGTKSFHVVSAEGVVSVKQVSSPKTQALLAQAASPADKAVLGEWTRAGTEDYFEGNSPRFASITGPSEMTSLGAPFGYGWYRISFKNATGAKALAFFSGSGDRLHVYQGGKLLSVVGVGPGAVPTLAIPLKKELPLVVLSENLGRFSDGNHMGEPKGVAGPIYEIQELRPGKPKLVQGEPVEVLSFRTPLWEVRTGDSTEPHRATWHLAHRRKSPIIMEIGPLPCRGLLLVDDKPVEFLDAAGPTFVTLDPEKLKSIGTVQFAPLADGDAPEPEDVLAAVAKAVTFYEAVANLAAKAEWSFAKWETPTASSFAPSKGRSAGPTWWRTTFKTAKTPAPLFIEPDGFTKGQIYVNGKHLCRFMASGPGGEHVPAPTRCPIPESWLKPGAPNELSVFDEHGGSPGKCRLVYDQARTPLTVAPSVV